MTEVEKTKQPVPSQQFLLMMIIQLKKCEKETGMSMVEWLEHFDETDEDMKTDAYNDATLVKTVRKLEQKLYPPEEK